MVKKRTDLTWYIWSDLIWSDLIWFELTWYVWSAGRSCTEPSSRNRLSWNFFLKWWQKIFLAGKIHLAGKNANSVWTTNLKSCSFPMSLTHTKPTFKEVRLRYNPPTLTFENNMKWYEKTWLGIFTKPESPEKSSNVGEKHLIIVFACILPFIWMCFTWHQLLGISNKSNHLVSHFFFNETLLDHEEDVVDTHHIGLACVANVK